MKKTFLTFCLLAFSFTLITVQAQVKSPAPSPSCKIEQMVGLTNVTIEYSRPSVKDRTVFGGLVPYDEVWRLGANAATKITFDKDVVMGGKEVKAGSYAMLAKPGRSTWKFMLFPHTSSNFGTYLRDDAPEPIMFTGESNDMGEVSVESLMITIDQLRNSSAAMIIAWDNVVVGVPIEVHTEKEVMASIDKTMAGPGANDYAAAANYYYAEGKDTEKALKWMTKAIEMGGERFWLLKNKAEMQAKLGDKEGAIKTAKRSLELAKEAGNNDYMKMNEANIKKWMM